jgi:TonB family protein
MSALGSTSQQPSFKPAAMPEVKLRLNWELGPWLPSLRENFRAAFTKAVVSPVSFRPGIFWKDVFVDQSLNWKAIARSYGGHVVFAGLVYVLSMPFYWQRIVTIENFRHDEITYVNPEEDVLVSEPERPEPLPRKLAPLVSRSSKAKTATTADARKRVVQAMAVPKWADNTTRTIVAPTAPKILANASIPDIVLSTPVPQAPPVASIASNIPRLVAPVLDITPVAPPPDIARAQLRMPNLPQASAIAPPVDTSGARNLAKMNVVSVPAAVNPEPKLTFSAAHSVPVLGNIEPVAPAPELKNAGATNLARNLPAPAQPIAPPPEVKASARSTGIAGNLPGVAEPVAPPPDLSSAGTANSAQGSLISLNLTPIAGAPRVPDGTRRGAFAGVPDARENGTGVPARQAGGTGPGGDSTVATKEELGIVAEAVPHGIVNGAPMPTLRELTSNSSVGNSLLAMARTSHLSLPPPRLTLPDKPDALDERVFRGRKYYTMALNTPNLTSVGGSWIFRFAERASSSRPGEVTAPIAVREVDPAYPADMIHDNVQGVVILYAIIRSDGSVAEVKVLEGFDDRLDENARKALSAWQFVPGTRDGNPVDLEAVVRIPFRSKRSY